MIDPLLRPGSTAPFVIPQVCWPCTECRRALRAVGKAMPTRHDFRDLSVADFYHILNEADHAFPCEFQFGEAACRDKTLGV